MLAPNAHSWVWQGIVPLVTGASFWQQINSCVWPSNQTHTIKVTTKIILSSAGPMSHACPVWPHPLPLAYYVILCIYVSFSDFWLRWLFPHLSQYVNVNKKPRRASSFTLTKKTQQQHQGVAGRRSVVIMASPSSQCRYILYTIHLCFYQCLTRKNISLLALISAWRHGLSDF